MEEGANVPSFWFYGKNMTTKNLDIEIRKISEERFKEADLQDCFLLEIVHNSSKLEVFIDSDSGVKFWQCQKLSRAIEAYLDETQILGESYTLEVSSPGVDKPLQLRRQFPRNIGRKLELLLKDDKIVTGKLEAIDDEKMTLKVQGAKKGQFKQLEVNFEDMISTKVLVSYKK